MCGFTGFLNRAGFANGEDALRGMADVIAHRGPDSEGYWTDGDAGIALAHRRLAIVDLSAAGHQPMHSHDGRFVLSYNGEIYNHLDLRRELDARGPIAWRGHSDTETLLEGFSEWGVAATLERANGMFALALWDRAERRLYLARDRMGEKPLYYGIQNGTLLFGSELKALARHPAWQGRIDRDALALFVRYNYVPGPYSIYDGIAKLPPAHYLEIGPDDADLPSPRAYWNIAEKARAGRAVPFSGSAEEAVDALEALMTDAIRIRMMADVPLGAFLSGGYDSSTVVALMQCLSARPVRTFSIGFSEADYDEAGYAKRVAAHLGTDHTELYVSPQDALDQLPLLPFHWDEPFADSSQIPTLLVSRLARSAVTVSLSGDAGDELFCGYGRYQRGHDIWRRLTAVPRPLRRVGGSVLDLARPGGRLGKIADLLGMDHGADLYRMMVSHTRAPEKLVLGARELPTALIGRDLDWLDDGDFRDYAMYLDMLSYLPDDILVKLDRASMAVSLESRVPMLDHRIVEFALGLPLSIKVRGAQTKWPLRQILYRHVPAEMMERPKMGFGVPIDSWLRGPLRGWAQDLLAPERLACEGFFNPKEVNRLWADVLAGRGLRHFNLWGILMFQAWFEAQSAS